ncbi:MAG: response regulator [Candidatus Schekmanbacteria bacterium]|nr:response regulator [Candidatus Schekmanbacteria bacterium]
MKVLVVDDSLVMRRIVKNALKQIGLEDAVEATNGKEALSMLAQGKVDLILTDWNMPEMNGLEFVSKIRETDKTTPIIMVTTQAGREDVVEAVKAGVNNYIVKPFKPETLKEKIDAVL